LAAVLIAIDQGKVCKLIILYETKTLVESCSTQLRGGDYKAGLDLFKPYWKVSMNELNTQTINSRATVKDRFGTSLGDKLINQQRV
jgi:hypothetical protein